MSTDADNTGPGDASLWQSVFSLVKELPSPVKRRASMGRAFAIDGGAAAAG